MKSQHSKIYKAVIITGYQCNNNCQFCINSSKRNLSTKTTKQIMEEIATIKIRGFSYLELIGGEVTIREDIIDLIKFASHLKFKNIALATNGRLFSYKEFAKKIIQAGLTDLIFSIHGHNSNLHDSLTQSKGSFNQMIEGIKNIKLLGLKRLGTNTTIVKQNYKYLVDIGKLIIKLGFRNSEFIFVDPTYGAAYDDFHKFVPKISQTSPYIHKCLDLGKKNKIDHWAIRYVPLCYFQGREDQVSEYDDVFHTEHLAPDFVNLNVETTRKDIARIKTDRCNNCIAFDKCEGIWKEYLKYYGDKELIPIN